MLLELLVFDSRNYFFILNLSMKTFVCVFTSDNFEGAALDLGVKHLGEEEPAAAITGDIARVRLFDKADCI